MKPVTRSKDFSKFDIECSEQTAVVKAKFPELFKNYGISSAFNDKGEAIIITNWPLPEPERHIIEKFILGAEEHHDPYDGLGFDPYQ